ncbi:MAG: type II secretion system protein GspM [Thiotrichales bacterium]
MNPREWFEQLQPRERILVGFGAAVALILLIYLTLWEPMARQVRDLRMARVAQQSQLDWMRDASTEARALQGNTAATRNTDAGGSLIGVVESSVNQTGLRNHVRRIEPLGGDRISIELRDAPFNALIGWVGLLQQQHGSEIEEFNTSRGNADGVVNARFTLVRGT